MTRTRVPRRTPFLTALGAAALMTLSPLAGALTSSAQAGAPETARPAATGLHAAATGVATDTTARRLLTVRFAAADRTVVAGRPFGVAGTVSRVTQAQVGRVGAGVPARFRLAITDETGRVLGTQAVSTAADGDFRTTVPAALTRGLAGAVDRHLALRALDATELGSQPYAAKDAGATAVTVRGKAKGLTLADRFVSSVGWVKPGEAYPSTIVITNPTAKAIRHGRVEVSAPEGTTIRKATGRGRHRVLRHGRLVRWSLPPVKAHQSLTLVLSQRAASVRALPTIVWRDLSTHAYLVAPRTKRRAVAHGPKVIPPGGAYDTARYGDRPFPIIPIQYSDRTYASGHSGAGLERTIDSPKFAGSTYNLYQEMSIKQLFPNGDVPSAQIATADFGSTTYNFTTPDPTSTNTCHGTTVAALGDVQGTPLYPERITDGVYNLPGTTDYYGDDANGSAIVGSLAGVSALQVIDSGCGPTDKVMADAVTLADPEIDYSDFDTDKDGVVDFTMGVFAGCGGNGASQLGAAACTGSGDAAPYDNIWPHSSSLEDAYTDPATGLPGVVTHDQDKDLQGRKLWWTDDTYRTTTTRHTKYPVIVRVGPINLNPESALDHASVISHEYGHSLGLPDFYSTGSRETYGDWNLMATDKSQNMDAFSRQELGWVVPEVLHRGKQTVKRWPDSKQDTHLIHWRTPQGRLYSLRSGRDGTVHNSRMYVAKLPGRTLIDAAAFDTGDKASKSHAWFSGSGNAFGCNVDGGAHNLDFAVPGLAKLPAGTTLTLGMKSKFDVEWDFDYGFVLTSTDGGKTFASHASQRSTPTTTATSNPNMNSCQSTYGNGITGTSGAYTDPVTVQADRTAGMYPDSQFLADSFDVSDLVGHAGGVLRLSYSTDPGLARPGWFIDDLTVTATTPSGKKVLLKTDFEKTGGYDDPHVFNGGCKTPDGPGAACTAGWQYVKAGAQAAFDHAYYLELRDRSGFDLDGNGQIDRDPIGWAPGLYLAYTDEAHGYGNAGTDDPPAQSPLDSTPTPGSETPNLNDAAYSTKAGRTTYSDSGAGHTDNYTDPGTASGNWEFDYRCLTFKVLKMRGLGLGPQKADGDLSGTVRIKLGKGCARFDYDYGPRKAVKDTAPVARIKASATQVKVGQTVVLDGRGSTDRETPHNLSYVWGFDDGGSIKDATGPLVRHAFDKAGTYRVLLRVDDPQGRSSVRALTVHVS